MFTSRLRMGQCLPRGLPRRGGVRPRQLTGLASGGASQAWAEPGACPQHRLAGHGRAEPPAAPRAPGEAPGPAGARPG